METEFLSDPAQLARLRDYLSKVGVDDLTVYVGHDDQGWFADINGQLITAESPQACLRIVANVMEFV